MKAAILSKWKSLAAAGIARGAADNYFSRGDFLLEPEVALWLARETGYRAGWLMFAELPPIADAALAAPLDASFAEGRRLALEDAIAALRGLPGAATLQGVSTSQSEGLSEFRAEQLRRALQERDEIPGEDAPPVKKRRKQ